MNFRRIFSKNKKLFFLLLTLNYFSIVSPLHLFAQKFNSAKQKENILYLEFDFYKTESQLQKNDSLLQNQSENTVASTSGKIIYKENPFYFEFFDSKASCKIFMDSTGVYKKDENGTVNFPQAMSDIFSVFTNTLSAFSEDAGLSLEGFTPGECKIQDDFTIQQWHKENEKDSQRAQLYFDKNFKLCKKVVFYDNYIYTNNIEESLNCGIYTPQKIQSQISCDDKIIYSAQIEFSNIKIKKEAELSKKNATDTGQKKSNQNSNSESFSSPALLAKAGFSFYKKFITKQDASSCRYSPTCSQFMFEAIKQNGFFGIIQGIDRLERCTRREHASNLYPEDQNHKHIDEVAVTKRKNK